MNKPTIPLIRWAFRKLKISAAEVMTDQERQGDVNRAGGDCICDICGFKYIEHPQILEYPDLYITCNWEVFKL